MVEWKPCGELSFAIRAVASLAVGAHDREL
jgi:hypothetical protein